MSALDNADPIDGGERMRAPVFIHDFVPLTLDLSAATGALPSLIDGTLIRDLVVDAWNTEVRAGVPAGLDALPCSTADVAVWVGEVRARSDAIILPLAWHSLGSRWIAPLDADLEIASFGPGRCHLHLMGRSALEPHLEAYSSQASIHHRLAVAIVRHVLDGLAHAVAG